MHSVGWKYEIKLKKKGILMGREKYGMYLQFSSENYGKSENQKTSRRDNIKI